MTSVASKYFQSVDKNEDNFKSNNFPIVISKSKVSHDRYYSKQCVIEHKLL